MRNYSSNNAISSFKLAKFYKIYPLENLKNLKRNVFVCQPASQSAILSTGTDLEPIPLHTYIASKLIVYACQSND